MESLKELSKNFWAKIVLVLKNFENSTIFEQLMRRYEALTPNEQSNIRKALNFVGIVIFGFLVLGGPLMLLSKVKKIKTLEKLEADAFIFQAEYEAKNKGYTPPAGWAPLSSNSANDLASSFNEYLMKIGVPEVYGSLLSNGDKLNLMLQEISIRQATRILFQLEALYPKLKATKFMARPNPRKTDILDIEASFEFNPAIGSQFAQGTGNSQAYPDVDGSDSTAETRGSGPGKTFAAGGGSGDGAGGGSGNTSGDFIPPPPGGENFDEFVPPEMPDDMPPPPPPPGFEGGGESE